MAAQSEIDVDVRQLGPLREIASGGQGTVHELLESANPLVYKEYAQPADVRETVLRRLVTFLLNLDEPVRDRLTERAAWPVGIVHSDGVATGFLMPRAFTPTPWPTDNPFRLKFLRDITDTLLLFDELGIAVGDLTPHSLLFGRHADPSCFFLDCDAMRLGEASALGAETVTSHNCYQLGLLALQVFDGDPRERDPSQVAPLPAAMRAVVAGSLRADPHHRPAIREWRDPVDTALRDARQRSQWKPVREPRAARGFAALAWAIGLPLLVAGVIAGIDNHGGSSGMNTIPTFALPTYVPTHIGLPQLDLAPVLPSLSVPLLPQVPPCVADIGPVVPGGAQAQAVAPALATFLCGLDADDHAAADVPEGSVSQANFAALVEAGRGGPFAATVEDVRPLNSVTLQADTRFSAYGQCWTTTFVLNPDPAGSYRITSLGPPENTSCG